MMRGGERVEEFLRPFVDSRTWDFCVIWKLGDDPSRFIEWVGCCCSGSYSDKNIKLEEEEGTESLKKGSLCRDEHNKHHIRTLACEALSHFPMFMPLYPGIHGEVVMSKSSKWLVNPFPGSNKDMFNTRVLVPVSDGLVELFSFKMKPFDESMVDMIISRCNPIFEPFPEQRLHFKIVPRVVDSMKSCMNLSFEGSSSKVDPLEKNVKANKKENFKSKNLISERKRRDRITQGMFALRSIVPKITKMNKMSTLSDAIDYIKELLMEKQKLEDELKELNSVEEESTITDPEAGKDYSKLNQKVKKSEMNLEVHEIGERDFLIRVALEHKRDGFKRLIEAVESCGLEIIDVNFRRLDLTVMIVLNVKAKKDGIASEDLRDLLLKMMINQTIDMRCL